MARQRKHEETSNQATDSPSVSAASAGLNPGEPIQRDVEVEHMDVPHDDDGHFDIGHDDLRVDVGHTDVGHFDFSHFYTAHLESVLQEREAESLTRQQQQTTQAVHEVIDRENQGLEHLSTAIDQVVSSRRQPGLGVRQVCVVP